MKKIIACLTAVFMMCTVLTACGNNNGGVGENGGDNEKLQIVATIFPQYDWVRQILGEQADHAELTLLLDNGVDLHSYQPTTDDIIKVSTCDLFIYTGGESDGWVEDALRTATNKDMIVINLLEVLGDAVKEEEVVEGMEHDHEHEHEEFDPDSVLDRPLSDFAGDWATIENALESGDLDEYITHQAEENEMNFDSQKAAYAERWASEYETLIISESAISFGGVSTDYEYIGFKIVEGDHGASVWYGFAATAPVDGIPAYVAFSDHGTGGDDHEDEVSDESGEHEHEEAAHYHMRYGNESFDALVAMENWAPTYFSADASGAEIAEAMGGHSHDHEEPELDEHVWLSLRHAQTLCGYISDRLGEVDPDHTDVYRANAAAYNEKLQSRHSVFDCALGDLRRTGNTDFYSGGNPCWLFHRCCRHCRFWVIQLTWTDFGR